MSDPHVRRKHWFEKRSIATVVTVLVVAVTVSFALGFVLGRYEEQRRNEWVEGRLISSAIESVRANALDTLSGDELIKRAVSGMLRELQDPYAAMLRSEGFDRYRGSLQGDGRGIGLTVREVGGVAIVTAVTPGSPAWVHGLRRGDRIISVNKEPFRTFSSRKDSTGLRDTLTFSVRRTSVPDTLTMSVIGRQWHQPAVRDAGFAAARVGYLHITAVSAGAADEVERSVESLIARGATSLLLDLRGNGGGLLEEGVKIASLFLPRGAPVTTVSGRSPDDDVVHYARGSRWPRLPMAVLVDGQTASSAELIAAALRDNGRSLLVGSQTYGKGYVQRIVRLSPDIALRLTTARWLTPSGGQVSRHAVAGHVAEGGLRPDIIVSDSLRYDPYLLPYGWSKVQIERTLDIADSVALQSIWGEIRDGGQDAARAGKADVSATDVGAAAIGDAAIGAAPSSASRSPSVVTAAASSLASSLADLEAKVRMQVAAMDGRKRPVNSRDAIAREALSRLAVVRILEASDHTDWLLELRARSDATLREALEVLNPGGQMIKVERWDPKPDRPSARSAIRDSAAVPDSTPN